MADYTFTQTGPEIQAILDGTFFNTANAYVIGQRIQQANEWYIAKAAIAAGAFDPADWIKVGITTLHENLAGDADNTIITFSDSLSDYDDIRVAGKITGASGLNGLYSSQVTVSSAISNTEVMCAEVWGAPAGGSFIGVDAITSAGCTAKVQNDSLVGSIVGVYGIKY